MWCYLVIAFFNWKIVIFQKTVVRICCILKRTQFPLILGWTSTGDNVQGLSLEQDVVEFDLRKQKSFRQGLFYATLNRVTAYDNLYCIGEFKKSDINVDKDALIE